MRVELRIATDEAGEIYILTKSDGFIRRVMSIHSDGVSPRPSTSSLFSAQACWPPA